MFFPHFKNRKKQSIVKEANNKVTRKNKKLMMNIKRGRAKKQFVKEIITALEFEKEIMVTSSYILTGACRRTGQRWHKFDVSTSHNLLWYSDACTSECPAAEAGVRPVHDRNY